MKLLNTKKNGFTLVEVVLVTSIFAIIVVGIILAINRSFVFMNNTRLSVRATNFAREGMEMMYNIRDTNWRRQSGERDKYGFNLGERDLGGHQLRDNYFQKGIYVLEECTEGKKEECGRENGNYFYAKSLNIDNLEINTFYSDDGFWDDKFDNKRDKAELSFDGTYSYYELNDLGDNEEKTKNIQDALIGNGIKFYRIVRVFGVYKKDDSSPDSTASDTQMKDGTPVEMRFCVKVFYVSQGKHSTELCGIMTNFME